MHKILATRKGTWLMKTCPFRQKVGKVGTIPLVGSLLCSECHYRAKGNAPHKQFVLCTRKAKIMKKEADDKIHWAVEIAKELKKKPLKKDSYDLGVRIVKLAKVDRKKGTSHCCCREPFKLLAFTHRDSGRRRVTRFVAICRIHFNLLWKLDENIS